MPWGQPTDGRPERKHPGVWLQRAVHHKLQRGCTGDIYGNVATYRQGVLPPSPLPAAPTFGFEAGFLQSVGYEQIGSFLVPPVPWP
jgi:hypothetical protein